MADTKILAELSDYLVYGGDEITKKWLDAIQRNPDIASSNHFGDAELVDHLPKFLENVAERLKDPQFRYQYSAGSRRPGRSHGEFRWRQGYRLEEIIREAGIIRWILLRDWLDAFEREMRPLDKQTRRTAEDIIHQAVEDLVADSAEQYLQEQQKSVSNLNLQLADAVAQLRQQKGAAEVTNKSDKPPP